MLLVEAGAALVGCVFLTPRSGVMYLGKLAVETARQGQGIGRQLFEVAADAACAEVPGNRTAGAGRADRKSRCLCRDGISETGRTAHAGYDRLTSVTMRCAL